MQLLQADAAVRRARRRRPATTSRCSLRNIASLLSEGDANGTWQRFIIVATPSGPNNEAGPSSAPANGPARRQPPARQPVPAHRGARPAAECEAGNEQYPASRKVVGARPAAGPARPRRPGGA